MKLASMALSYISCMQLISYVERVGDMFRPSCLAR